MAKTAGIFFKILTLGAIGFIISSCQDDLSQRFSFFELVVDPNYNFNEERWVIATDVDGRVLDASQYQTGQTVQLRNQRLVSSPFTITLFRTCRNCSVKYFDFTSYCEITPGSKWTLAWPKQGNLHPIEDENAGKASVEVSNLPTPIRLNPQGDNYLITSFFNANNISYKAPYDPLLVFDVWLRNKPTDILILAVNNGDSRLVRFPLDSTMKSKSLKLDYITDFSPPDHGFTIQPEPNIIWQFSEINGYLQSLNELTNLNKNHTLAYATSDGKKKFTIGYNNGYKSYLTNWGKSFESSYRNKYIFQKYYKLGDPPTTESFIFPTVDFTIIDRGFNEFDFVTTGNFAYRESSWYYDEFAWKVISPTNSKNKIMTELPEGMSKSFGIGSDFFSKLVLGNSFFTINVKNNSYEEVIAKFYSTDEFQNQATEYFILGKDGF